MFLCTGVCESTWRLDVKLRCHASGTVYLSYERESLITVKLSSAGVAEQGA